jgi:hypothetical protein
MSREVSDEPTKLESLLAERVKKLKDGAPLPVLYKEMVKVTCRSTRDEFYLLSFEDKKSSHSIKHTPCEFCAVPYYYHRPTDPCELSILEATENNAAKPNFIHPTRCSDCGVLLSAHHEDEVVDSETDDPIEEEAPPSSSSSLPSTSSSLEPLSSISSSSSSSSSVSSSTITPQMLSMCRLSYEEATRFCAEAADFLQACKLCGKPNLDHPHKSAVASFSDASYRLPSMDQFPKFRDPKDKQMLDPSLFFNRLERAFDLYSVPDRLKQRVLIACVKDELMQKWVEDNIVALKLDWSHTKDVFTVKYTDAQLTNDLVEDLDSLTQNIGERVHSYGEKYTALLTRLRYPLTSPSHIFACERGFVPEIRSEMARIKAQKSVDSKPFEFDSITALLNAAQQIEKGLKPAHSRRSRTRHDQKTGSSASGKRHRDTSVSNVETVTKNSRAISSDRKRGRGSNSGRNAGGITQHYDSNSSVNNIAANRSRGSNLRGTFRGRGHFRGRGRGGHNSSSSSSSNSGLVPVARIIDRQPPLQNNFLVNVLYVVNQAIEPSIALLVHVSTC